MATAQAFGARLVGGVVLGSKAHAWAYHGIFASMQLPCKHCAPLSFPAGLKTVIEAHECWGIACRHAMAPRTKSTSLQLAATLFYFVQLPSRYRMFCNNRVRVPNTHTFSLFAIFKASLSIPSS